MNSAVVYGTQSPVMSSNETSRLLHSSNTPAGKGKGKACAQQGVDLEAQLDGASHSHEHRTHRHHRNRLAETLIANEIDDQEGPFTDDAGNLVSLTRYYDYPLFHN